MVREMARSNRRARAGFDRLAYVAFESQPEANAIDSRSSRARHRSRSVSPAARLSASGPHSGTPSPTSRRWRSGCRCRGDRADLPAAWPATLHDILRRRHPCIALRRTQRDRDHVLREMLAIAHAGIEASADDVNQRARGNDFQIDLRIGFQERRNHRRQHQIDRRRRRIDPQSPRRHIAQAPHLIQRAPPISVIAGPTRASSNSPASVSPTLQMHQPHAETHCSRAAWRKFRVRATATKASRSRRRFVIVRYCEQASRNCPAYRRNEKPS
jgi:hypothetical protein